MPTVLEQLRFCAKYPFTREAKEQAKNINLNDISYETVEQAHDYIEGLLKADAAFFRGKLGDINNSGENYLKREMMLFPLSKIIGGLAEGSVKRDYAGAEARKTHYFLQFEEDVGKIAAEFFHLEQNKIPFYEFLKYAPKGEEMKLVNSELSGGSVSVDGEALLKLIPQYVFRNIMETKIEKKSVPKIFIFFADELKRTKSKLGFDAADLKDFGKADILFFPPCVRKIVADLKSGEKVGHIPRFVLSTFFANANVPIDEAIKYFQSQPNFNEKKTRYYLEHSYGLKGGTKYSVPACVKMNSYGVCVRDSTCLWRHPLEYYSRKKGAVKKSADIKQGK